MKPLPIAKYLLIALFLGIGFSQQINAQSLEDCARFSNSVYKLNKKGIAGGWVLIQDTTVKKWGFQGGAYFHAKDKKLIIEFAGTQFTDPKDILTDLGIAGGVIEDFGNTVTKTIGSVFQPNKKTLDAARKTKVKGGKETQKQMTEARNFYERVLKNGKLKGINYSTVIAGHSLGGFLAQVLAAEKNLTAKTFNAPGAAAFTTKRGGKITNYVRMLDMVGGFGEHLGTTVAYRGVYVEPFNFAERYVIRNHSITLFVRDLRQGMKPL